MVLEVVCPRGQWMADVSAGKDFLTSLIEWEIRWAEANVAMETFEVQWVVRRLEADCVPGMSLDFDDMNNWVRVSNVSENSLSG